jgi:hypothetical protein
MFHVIVLGGIGLVSTGCGGATTTEDPTKTAHDGGVDGAPPCNCGPVFPDDAFPSETATFVDAGYFPSEGKYAPDAVSPPAIDASHGVDAFPDETATFLIDAGAHPVDAPPAVEEDAGCVFPDETAFVPDAACVRRGP